MEPFEIANCHRNAKLYNESRLEVFWRLDEMCQHNLRQTAMAEDQPGFSYVFSRLWADHLESASANGTQPPAPGAILLKLYVPVDVECLRMRYEGKECRGVTAAQAVDAMMPEEAAAVKQWLADTGFSI